MFAFNASFGSVFWIYANEILEEKGIAVVGFVNLASTVVFGSGANILFQIFTVPGVYIGLFLTQLG